MQIEIKQLRRLQVVFIGVILTKRSENLFSTASSVKKFPKSNSKLHPIVLFQTCGIRLVFIHNGILNNA